MIPKILFFIMYFQAIRWTISWDPLSPLILNKKGDDFFLPNCVEEVQVDGESQINYLDFGDMRSLTYTFCRSYYALGASPGGLLGKLFKEDPSRDCPFTIDYDRTAVIYPNGDSIPCGDRNERLHSGYRSYYVNVKLSIDGETAKTFSLYNYCYDDLYNFSTLYAYYDLVNPSLLKNPLLKGERDYAFDPLRWPNRNQPDVDLSKYYKAQSVYVPYEVAISKFIPFAHWRKAFIQWHNVAPMNKFLVKPWEEFIEKMTFRLAAKFEYVRVLSGIYGMKQNGIVEFLPHSEITIPEYWWILLYNVDRTRGISLIMNNHSYAKEEHRNLLCEESICDKAKLEDVIPQEEKCKHAAIYCCSARTIASKVPISSYLLSDDDYDDVLVFDEPV